MCKSMEDCSVSAKSLHCLRLCTRLPLTKNVTRGLKLKPMYLRSVQYFQELAYCLNEFF